MWAAALAHNGLLGTGRVTDWASHRLEHELSALYDIAHGAGLAIVFPAWMKYVLSKGCVSKLRQFAVRVFDVSEDFGSDEAIASEGIARLERFYRSLGLPTTLHESGIGEKTSTAWPTGRYDGRRPSGQLLPHSRRRRAGDLSAGAVSCKKGFRRRETSGGIFI